MTDVQEEERQIVSLTKHSKAFRRKRSVAEDRLVTATKPEVRDYRWHKGTVYPQSEPATIQCCVADSEPAKPPALPPRRRNEALKVPSERPHVEPEEIDWFGYYLAVFTYRISKILRQSPDIPLLPHEPFSIDRLRSSGERLYVAAVPAWSDLAKTLGDVIIWKDFRTTLVWLAIYALLVVTSKFLAFLHGVLLYQLIRRKLATTSSRNEQDLNIEAEDAVDAMLPPDTTDRADDFGALADAMQSSMSQPKAGKNRIEIPARPSKRQKYKAIWDSFKEQHGKGAVVVVNDIADMHERVANTFRWQDTSASLRFCGVLCLSAIVSHFLSTPVLVKLGQVGFGVLVFFIIPMAARQPQYESLSWLLGDAPTHAELGLQALRARRAAGQPLNSTTRASRATAAFDSDSMPSADSPVSGTLTQRRSASRSATLSLTTTEDETATTKTVGRRKFDPQALGDSAGRLFDSGHKWLQLGKGVVRGEMDIGFQSGVTRRPRQSNTATYVSVSTKGHSITLTPKRGSSDFEGDDSPESFAAQCNGRMGTLYISPQSLRFAAFREGKAAGQSIDATNESENAVASSSLSGSNVEVAIADITAIRQTSKTAATLTTERGIAVEMRNTQMLRFPRIRHRDEAYLCLLSVMEGPLEAV